MSTARTARPATLDDSPATAAAAAVAAPKKKLSYKDQRELDLLPARIEELETRIAGLGQRMADPGFYQQPAAEVAAAGAELSSLQAALEVAYARWAELDG